MHPRHLYVHVPFCARRCVYCDFSIAVRRNVPADEFIGAVEREWRLRIEGELEVDTVYFGGGTPSRLGGEGVSRLMEVVRLAKIHAGAEVTLEANPEDVTATTARSWAGAGINRVSLGVQSFDDRVLQWMHRTHDAAAAYRAIGTLRDVGIHNLSLDLIFALPAHLDRHWMADLETAMGLQVPHLSVYGLTVESHTPLGRWVARSDVVEAPEEAFEREFLMADRALRDAGFEHYEVSNYGQTGSHSRHNWAYWERHPYVGIGPSAHEFDGTSRRWNVAPYAEWIRRLASDADPIEGREALSSGDVRSEEVYLGLRTQRGIALSDRERTHVVSWVDAGWATIGDNSRLRLTPLGWLRLDSLASDLTVLRSRY